MTVARDDDDDLTVRVRVGPQGRIVIPAGIRETLGMDPGTVVAMRVEDRRLVLERPQDILDRVRAELRAANPAGASMVDDLLAERRDEARREQAEHEREG